MTAIPPAGPPLPFDAWARIVADDVRRRLPGVRITRRGSVVYLRLADVEVTITDDRGDFQVRRTGSPGSGVHDADRHDDFTARTIAKTAAGMLDARQSMPDKP